MWRRFLKEEMGEGMVEYGLIIALVALLLIGILMAMNGGFKSIFGQITNLVNNSAVTGKP